MGTPISSHAHGSVLGLAIFGLRFEPLSGLEKAKIERAGRLLQQARIALSDFEADLVEEVCERVAKCGDTARITENEWHVVDTSIDAMDALLGEAPDHG